MYKACEAVEVSLNVSVCGVKRMHASSSCCCCCYLPSSLSLAAFTFLALLTTATLCLCCLCHGHVLDVCTRVVLDVCTRVDVVIGVLCREKPLARQFSPDLLTESSSSSSSSSLGVLEVVKGVVRSASSTEEAVEGRDEGLKRKGREGWSRGSRMGNLRC